MKHLFGALILSASGLAAHAAHAAEPLGADLGEMAAGRARLERLADEGARQWAPGAMARAEASFACWTAYPEDVDVAGARCRDAFMTAIAQAEPPDRSATTHLAAQ